MFFCVLVLLIVCVFCYKGVEFFLFGVRKIKGKKKGNGKVFLDLRIEKWRENFRYYWDI